MPEFDRNLLNDIRITFNYILKTKRRLHVQVSIRSFNISFLMKNNSLKKVSKSKRAKSKALNIETLIDEPINRQIVVNPTDVTPLAAHSETSQNYILPLVAKHIQRKEHLLTSSSFSESI